MRTCKLQILFARVSSWSSSSRCVITRLNNYTRLPLFLNKRASIYQAGSSNLTSAQLSDREGIIFISRDNLGYRIAEILNATSDICQIFKTPDPSIVRTSKTPPGLAVVVSLLNDIE